MKLFTAIVALAGMSSATASLRGNVLPSDMKDLLHKEGIFESVPYKCSATSCDKPCGDADATTGPVLGTICQLEDDVDIGDCMDGFECVSCAPQNMPHAFYCRKETAVQSPGSIPSGDTSEFSE